MTMRGGSRERKDKTRMMLTSYSNQNINAYLTHLITITVNYCIVLSGKNSPSQQILHSILLVISWLFISAAFCLHILLQRPAPRINLCYFLESSLTPSKTHWVERQNKKGFWLWTLREIKAEQWKINVSRWQCLMAYCVLSIIITGPQHWRTDDYSGQKNDPSNLPVGGIDYF